MQSVSLDNPLFTPGADAARRAGNTLEAGATANAGRPAAGRQPFAMALREANPYESGPLGRHGRQPEDKSDRKLREAAQQMVAQALFMPLLKQARESPFKVERFHGGQGEQAIGGQLDAALADRMAGRADGERAMQRNAMHHPRARADRHTPFDHAVRPDHHIVRQLGPLVDDRGRMHLRHDEYHNDRDVNRRTR